MFKRLLYVLLLAFSSQCSAGFFDFFTHKEEIPEEKMASLRKQQIDYPEDPVINYNLGVALYKQQLFDQAKVAFQRTVQHTDGKRDGVLKLQALFNGANSGYQNSLRILPVGWQTKEDIADDLLSAAINHVTDAIGCYKKALDKNPLLYKAQTNLRKAEELKKQLEAKLKQQQQNPDHKQKQQDDNSSQQQSGDKSNQNSAGQDKDSGKGRSDNTNKPDQHGQDNPDGDKKDKDAQQQDTKHGDQSKNDDNNKPSEQEGKQAEQEKQASQEQEEGQAAEGQEGEQGDGDKKETAMAKALLDSLGNDEQQAQKRFLNRQIGKDKPLQHPGQKPW